MNPAAIIQRKRDGKALSESEIREFIAGLASGEVADYQATAFLMAVYFQGMSLDETVALTRAMLESGVRYRYEGITGKLVDKHSTGGVGDKVSLILAPLAAACGLKVPMMSGRGLGHSGGTLDKLESIPGFNVNLDQAGVNRLLRDHGFAMFGQSEKVVPADRKLYALRDVTATVECIPLITASILSKKLAEGCDALVLDVKVGSGAFMKSLPEAKALTKALTQVARKLGLKCRALLTNMNQPLGYSAGHVLEVYESLEILRNEKNAALSSCDLKELTLQLCAHMLEIAGVCRTLTQGRKLAIAKLTDGSAWRVFQDLVRAQGGDLDALLGAQNPYPTKKFAWKSRKSGYVTAMDTQALGQILVDMGGGRKRVSDAIDPGVGLVFHKKLGAPVKAGETLATAYAPAELREGPLALKSLEERFHSAIQIARARKPVSKLVFAVY